MQATKSTPKELADPIQPFVGFMFAIGFDGTAEKRVSVIWATIHNDNGRDIYHLLRHIWTGGDTPKKFGHPGSTLQALRPTDLPQQGSHQRTVGVPGTRH